MAWSSVFQWAGAQGQGVWLSAWEKVQVQAVLGFILRVEVLGNHNGWSCSITLCPQWTYIHLWSPLNFQPSVSLTSVSRLCPHLHPLLRLVWQRLHVSTLDSHLSGGIFTTAVLLLCLPYSKPVLLHLWCWQKFLVYFLVFSIGVANKSLDSHRDVCLEIILKSPPDYCGAPERRSLFSRLSPSLLAYGAPLSYFTKAWGISQTSEVARSRIFILSLHLRLSNHPDLRKLRKITSRLLTIAEEVAIVI